MIFGQQSALFGGGYARYNWITRFEKLSSLCRFQTEQKKGRSARGDLVV